MRAELEDILLEVSRSDKIDRGDLDAAQQLIIQSAVQGLHITRAGIWLLNDNKDALHCAILCDNGDITETDTAIHAADFPSYFAALRKERTIIANDAYDNTATLEFAAEYLPAYGIFSMLDIPLRHRGEMIGVLCCEGREKGRRWHEDEVAFVGMLADIYGRALSAYQREIYERQLVAQNAELENRVKARTASLEQALDNFRMAQQRLVETEKMAALGKLVAGVAHEVNTPLGVAVTATSLCKQRIKQLHQQFNDGKLSKRLLLSFIEEAEEAYDLMESNLHRAAKLIQNFKRTAVDQSSFELVDVEMVDYLRSLVVSLKPLVKKKLVDITIHGDAQLQIKTFQGAIAQIITNLVSNTNEHAFNEANEQNQISINVSATENGLQLVFADNGRGMEQDVQKQAFNPFYTTSRNQGGSGLGLSIVYNLVTQKLKGQISLRSVPGEGSEFTIQLPNLEVS